MTPEEIRKDEKRGLYTLITFVGFSITWAALSLLFDKRFHSFGIAFFDGLAVTAAIFVVVPLFVIVIQREFVIHKRLSAARREVSTETTAERDQAVFSKQTVEKGGAF